MFNIRRAPLASTAASRNANVDTWDEYGQDDAGGEGHDPRLDDIADALAVEFETYAADPMDPVDIETGNVSQGRGTSNFDQWDDSALEQIAQELSHHHEFDPMPLQPGVLPPHPMQEEDAAPHARGGVSRLALLLGMVGIAGVGAVGWAMFGNVGIVGYGEPVVIAAPTAPYKIIPKEGDTIDEPIDTAATFDPVSGLPPKGEERLVAREEEVPDLPGVTPQVNRVILPDGQEIVEEPVAPTETGPRRVRTVLVRPDGSIIDSAPGQAAPALPSPTDAALANDVSPIAEAITAAEGQSAAGLPPLPPSELVEAPADDPVAALLPPLPDEPVQGQPVAVAPAVPPAAEPAPAVEVAAVDAAAPAIPAAPAGTVPDAFPGDVVAPVAETPTEAAAPAAVVDAPMPRNRPQPPAEPAPAPVAAAPAPVAPEPVAESVAAAPVAPSPAADGPIDLTRVATAAPGVPAPVGAARSVAVPEAQTASVAPPAVEAPPPAAAPAGAAFVQLSSQRSEAAALAAFRGLQAQHTGLLGGLQPDVQRADLGAKGIYYRVRVAQPSRDAANGLCASLKSVGADCLIARR